MASSATTALQQFRLDNADFSTVEFNPNSTWPLQTDLILIAKEIRSCRRYFVWLHMSLITTICKFFHQVISPLAGDIKCDSCHLISSQFVGHLTQITWQINRTLQHKSGLPYYIYYLYSLLNAISNLWYVWIGLSKMWLYKNQWCSEGILSRLNWETANGPRQNKAEAKIETKKSFTNTLQKGSS